MCAYIEKLRSINQSPFLFSVQDHKRDEKAGLGADLRDEQRRVQIEVGAVHAQHQLELVPRGRPAGQPHPQLLPLHQQAQPAVLAAGVREDAAERRPEPRPRDVHAARRLRASDLQARRAGRQGGLLRHRQARRALDLQASVHESGKG